MKKIVEPQLLDMASTLILRTTVNVILASYMVEMLTEKYKESSLPSILCGNVNRLPTDQMIVILTFI